MEHHLPVNTMWIGVYSPVPLWGRSSLAVRASTVSANAKVSTILGVILASSDTVDSEWRQMKQHWMKYFKNSEKSPSKTTVELRLVFRASHYMNPFFFSLGKTSLLDLSSCFLLIVLYPRGVSYRRSLYSMREPPLPSIVARSLMRKVSSTNRLNV